jgi:hypothetical protein
VRAGIVAKAFHERVPLQGPLHGQPLNAYPSSMDHPDFAKAGGVRFVDVLFNHRRDVARGERVKVELRFDRDPNRVVVGVRPLIHTSR